MCIIIIEVYPWEVYPPDDASRPCRPKAGQGLVNIKIALSKTQTNWRNGREIIGIAKISEEFQDLQKLNWKGIAQRIKKSDKYENLYVQQWSWGKASSWLGWYLLPVNDAMHGIKDIFQTKNKQIEMKE